MCVEKKINKCNKKSTHVYIKNIKIFFQLKLASFI